MNALSLLPFLLGAYLIAGLKGGVRCRLGRAATRIRQARKPKTERARDYVARINGRVRESYMVRSRREARDIYEQTGQKERFAGRLRLALLAGIAGAGVGLAVQNPLLALVLAVGSYYLPLWLSQFSLYRYNRFLNEQLETALSLVTASYTRNNDILGAVEENLANINEPVKSVFAAFLNNLKFVDPNAPAQLERMKAALDNAIWRQWCDSLILCQSDHTLRAALAPILNKFSDQKAQQEENETRMLLPLRNAVVMICLTLCVIPLFWAANPIWYHNLVATPFGQVSLVTAAVITLVTVNKAIRLSKPIEYDV
jgi:tight adherence protein B